MRATRYEFDCVGVDPHEACAVEQCGHAELDHVHNETAPVCNACKVGPAPGCFEAWHAFVAVARVDMGRR